MSTMLFVSLAFAIGAVSGLRSLTAPAVVAWAAHLKWINHTGFDSEVLLYILTIAAIAELVADKLPKTASRTKLAGLTFRLIFGGLSGAALASAAGQPYALGAALAALGALAGAFGGYQARTRLVKALKVPDFVVAVIEDAVAIGAGLLIVSRF